MEFCQVQNSLCVQVLRSPILAALAYCTALEQWTSAKLRRGARNGITELWLLVIFNTGRHLYSPAAITLGIGPHFSYYYCDSGVFFGKNKETVKNRRRLESSYIHEV